MALPDWVPVEAWQEWLKIRPKVKAPNTPYALRLALKALTDLKNEGQDPEAVLNQSALRGWRGLFPVKTNGTGTPDYSKLIASLPD